ncbi:MAG: GNAT family N-acetyltransferase [Planctomycetales bacterium]|nr:GNAT family N-acetyltransferase [Planctomycetales bacterium]
MAVTYFKRYRMELRLDSRATQAMLGVPEGFELLPWSPRLMQRHADVKWESFREEIDAHVFPCLGDRDGCRRLMREISGRKDFIPEATWLACRSSNSSDAPQTCGTVQGLMTSAREGAIQNLGVHPACRDKGVGRALLACALQGFHDAGCRFAHLEVTVENTAAIRLYERFGFHRVETLFKVADVQYA